MSLNVFNKINFHSRRKSIIFFEVHKHIQQYTYLDFDNDQYN